MTILVTSNRNLIDDATITTCFGGKDQIEEHGCVQSVALADHAAVI